MIKNVLDESRNQGRVVAVDPMPYVIRSDINAVRYRENPFQFAFDLEAYNGTAVPPESAWRCGHHNSHRYSCNRAKRAGLLPIVDQFLANLLELRTKAV